MHYGPIRESKFALTKRMKGLLMQSFSNFVLASALAMAGLQPVAAANLVSNGSFENFTGTLGSDNTTALLPGAKNLTAWTIFGGNIAVLRTPNPYNLTPSDGSYFVDLTGSTDHGSMRGVSQVISGLSVGSTYSLTFDLGIRNGVCSIGNDCAGPIRANASVGMEDQSFTFNSADNGNSWGTFGFTFVATSESLPLMLTGQAGFRYIGLDNVSISAVPEPSSLFFTIAALPVLVATTRRRQAKVKFN